MVHVMSYGFFFGMSPDVPAFQSPHFYKWLYILNWCKMVLVADKLLSFTVLPILKKKSIYLFGMHYDVNFQFTP